MRNYGDGGKQFPDVPEFRDFGGGGGSHGYRGQSGINPGGMYAGGNLPPAQMQPYGAPVQYGGGGSYQMEQMPQFIMGSNQSQQGPQIAGSYNAMMGQNQWPITVNQSSYGNMTGQSQQPMNRWAQRGFGV